MIGAFERRPAAYTGRGTGPQKIDRRATPEIVPAPIFREVPFMCAPAEFRRLRSLADEPVDRPGINEFARHFRDPRDLSVPFGNMDDLDPQLFGQQRPIVALSRG